MTRAHADRLASDFRRIPSDGPTASVTVLDMEGHCAVAWFDGNQWRLINQVSAVTLGRWEREEVRP